MVVTLLHENNICRFCDIRGHYKRYPNILPLARYRCIFIFDFVCLLCMFLCFCLLVGLVLCFVLCVCYCCCLFVLVFCGVFCGVFCVCMCVRARAFCC